MVQPFKGEREEGLLQAEPDDYGDSVLLPYTPGVKDPARLVSDLRDNCFVDASAEQRRQKGIHYTFGLVRVPEGEDAPPLPDTVVDLGIDCENDKLPRRLEFPGEQRGWGGIRAWPRVEREVER